MVSLDPVLANAAAAGIVLGARVPIILMSRADNVAWQSCAVLYAHAQRAAGAEIGTLVGEV